MAILHFRYKERRRSVRVSLTVPLKVHGETEAGEKFSLAAASQSVSLYGVSFAFEAPVALGQALRIENEITRKSMDSKVVAVRRGRDGKAYIGVEFSGPGAEFWHMAFPVPGAKPLRRAISTRATATN